MVMLIFQSLCICIFAVSLLLTIVELRTRFDRVFLYYGISSMILCLFCGFDLWEKFSSNEFSIQHAIFCFFPPIFIKYLAHFKKDTGENRVRILLFCGVVISSLFLSGAMFRPGASIGIPTPLYFIVFVPYLIVSIGIITQFLFSNVGGLHGNEKKLFQIHIVNLFVLVLCAIFDMAQLVFSRVFIPLFPSFTIIGVLVMSSIITYMFTARIILLIQERQMYIEKLQSSYQELEQAKGLSEIGKSTSIINHEIRNFTCVISGYAQYLFDQAPLTDKHKKMVSTILETAEKISTFSNEILDFSKSKILANKRPLAIASLIKQCIKVNMNGRENCFSYDNFSDKIVVHGDWRKLEQVFLNLFRNAFEANATVLSIKMIPSDFVLLVSVEDNGTGCNQEEFSKIFQAFFTTKDYGTGLGLATSRSIIEGHGGYMSVVSKNLVDEKAHGLIFNLSFPLFETAPQRSNSVVFIKDEIEHLQEIIQVFRNVFVVPKVYDSIADLALGELDASYVKIIANPRIVSKILDHNSALECYSLVCGSDNVQRVVSGPPHLYEGIFNEEFILTRLLETLGTNEQLLHKKMRFGTDVKLERSLSRLVHTEHYTDRNVSKIR